MPRKQLAELLEKLREEIHAEQSLSGEDREELVNLREQIGGLLAEGEDQDLPESSALMSPLQRGIDRFERSHPSLTMLLGRIMDTLTKMGI